VGVGVMAYTLRRRGVVSQGFVIEDGLILHVDAGNVSSYPGSGTTWFDVSGNGNHLTLFNSPTFSVNNLTFNGTNQHARTSSTLNLSGFNAVTVEIDFRCNFTTSPTGMLFEHGPNWNNTSMSFGLVPNTDSSTTYVNDENHTNQFQGTGVFNYNGINSTNIKVHSNHWSRVSDSTGRLAYMDGALRNIVVGSSVTSSFPAFRNDFLYVASRAANSIFIRVSIFAIRIYNRKLSAQEIAHNFQAVRSRYGI